MCVDSVLLGMNCRSYKGSKLGSFGAITLERLGVQRPKFCTWLDMVGAQLFTKFRIGAAWERGKSL